MKKFKYFFMSLVLVTCMLGSSASASASSYSTGKAVIPWYYQGTGDLSYYSVSNVTDYPIHVTVTLFNLDGSLVTDDNSSSSGRIYGSSQLLNYSDQLQDSTLTFTLNPHCTGNFMMYTSSISQSGYGTIQWRQDGSATQGLVVTGFEQFNYQARSLIPVNNGMPF
jgi:hypothetical protein